MLKKALSLLVFCTSAMLTAQELPKSPFQLQEMSQALQREQASALVKSAPIEHAVDPREYVVGPGDVLYVYIAKANFAQKLVINPEGNLLIPSAGTVSLSHLTMQEAKDRIIAKIKSRYLSDEIDVSLAELRSFRVTVSGAVYNPGLVTVNALHRVSEAIRLCGGFIKPIQVRSASEQVTVETPLQNEVAIKTSKIKSDASLALNSASKRNIRVHRKNGEKLHADVEKYELTGDLKANPFLLDGDVIIVPTENTSGHVEIAGAVRTPGVFEFVPGECLKDILDMAHGFAMHADSSFIELFRFEQPNSKPTKITVRLNHSSPDSVTKVLRMALLPDDRLYVRFIPQYHEKRQVEVEGEVYYPGVYALSQQESYLTEIISRAGGFTPDAALANAYIQRMAFEDIQDPEFERLKKMSITDMNDIERDYFKFKQRGRTGGMGIDFVGLFEKGDKSQDVIMQNRDRVVVPAREKTVSVAGQVINPGLFPYEPGRTLAYYIEKAGGYNWNARTSKIRLIKRRTGEWLAPNDSIILEVGDTIFVPEKPVREWWDITKDIITVTAQVATIFLVIYNTTR